MQLRAPSAGRSVSQRSANSSGSASSNAANHQADTLVGIAWVELSTGRFEAGVYPRRMMMDELTRLAPSEVLLRDDDGESLA